jgi:hypothetical protein
MIRSNILDRINELSVRTPYIKKYSSNPVNILKGMGNIIGEIDKQHIEFLKLTNGASILDYCFWGFKNPNLYPRNIYEEMLEVWHNNPLTSNFFWCIAGNSIGEYFGYIPKKDSEGNHFIAYFTNKTPDKLILVSSSFNIFINKFIDAVSDRIREDNESLDIDYSFFLDINRIASNDIELGIYLSKYSVNVDLLEEHACRK